MKGNTSLLRHYILNTSFHGLRYIAEKRRHWSERYYIYNAHFFDFVYLNNLLFLFCIFLFFAKSFSLSLFLVFVFPNLSSVFSISFCFFYQHFFFQYSIFFKRVFWVICCILSWTASGLLIKSAWEDFQNNAISFVIDTSYLKWNTNFPSIAICESDNQKRIAESTDKTYGDPHDYNLDEIVKELVYYRGLSFYTLQICGPEATTPNENCFKKNFSDFSREVRSTCDQILKKCQWNDQIFNCCEYFAELDSEMGTCFAINSIQTRRFNVKKMPMVSNISTGPGSLRLEINGVANIYILGEQEVPSLTTLTADVLQVGPHIYYHRYLGIKDIENQLEVPYLH